MCFLTMLGYKIVFLCGKKDFTCIDWGAEVHFDSALYLSSSLFALYSVNTEQVLNGISVAETATTH